MAERVTIGVGAEHSSGPVVITVQGTGEDAAGPFATVSLGKHPDVTYARLRLGEAQPIPDGPTLRLAGIAPAGYAPAIALEISR
jgi:hypothetical protein